MRIRHSWGVPTATVRAIHDLHDYETIGGLGRGESGVLRHPADSLILKLQQRIASRMNLASELRLLLNVSSEALRNSSRLPFPQNWIGVRNFLGSALRRKRNHGRDPRLPPDRDVWSETRFARRYAAHGLPIVSPLGVVVDRARGQEYVCEPRLPKLCGVVRRALDTGDSRLLSWARQAWNDSVGLILNGDCWGDIHLGHALVDGNRVVFTDSNIAFGPDAEAVMEREIGWWREALRTSGREIDFDLTRFDDAVDLHFRVGYGCQLAGRPCHK